MIYVEEGSSYTVGVTVTNTSTKAGVPCGATLGLRVRASGDGVTLIPTTDKSVSLAAGESRSFSYGMSIPMGLGGGTGVIDAVVTHGYGILASDTEPLTIRAVAAPECTRGDTKCIGYSLYTCGSDEKWHLTEKNSTQCGYTPPPPPVCTPGEEKCIGRDLCWCSPEGKWIVIERNSYECIYP